MGDENDKLYAINEEHIEDLVKFWAAELAIPESVARDGVMEWKSRGAVTIEEQIEIFEHALMNFSVKKLVDEGLLDMTVDENGEFWFKTTEAGVEALRNAEAEEDE